jgi:hypothetical protein
MVKKSDYISQVLKLLWDAEGLKDIFNIEIQQGPSAKRGILVATDRRAIVILENKPGHKIDFKKTLRIYSIRLTSIIDATATDTSIRISAKNHGMELFFRYEKNIKAKINQALNLLLQKKQETRYLSDIWRKFVKE